MHAPSPEAYFPFVPSRGRGGEYGAEEGIPVLVEKKKTMAGEYVDMMRCMVGEVRFERVMGRKPTLRDVAVKVR